jgi:lipopolysaccharide/colanic/teichoic acid biosynthesis glycosyltransferase
MRSGELLKRSFDIIVSFLGILALLPTFAIVALLIRANSEGAVLYRGVRTGRHGKPFRIFKFRTMVANAEHIGGTSTADNDPRITRIGRWLRRVKIDELPQLINVLKGEMSLVGPRPEVEEYTRLYNPEERAILSVSPGITDLASMRFRDLNAILAKADDPDKYFAEKILPVKNSLRLEYVREHSFWMDLRIILQTLRSVWRK